MARTHVLIHAVGDPPAWSGGPTQEDDTAIANTVSAATSVPAVTVAAAGIATISGYNTSLGGETQAQMDARIVRLGSRVTCGRGYYGFEAVPSNGSGFTSGGKEYILAGKHLAGSGVTSDQRVNVSIKHPGYGESGFAARKTEIINYALSVPAGWTVWICHHEYNNDTPYINGGSATWTAFTRGMYEIAWGIYDALVAAGKITAGQTPNVRYFINFAGSGLKSGTWDDLMAPRATAGGTWYGITNYRGMPPGTIFGPDDYDNPSSAGGARGYATNYGDPVAQGGNGKITTNVDNVYDTCNRLGYLAPGFGVGYGEVWSLRRVAPQITNSTLGWVTTRPPDTNGARMAQALQYYFDYMREKFGDNLVLVLWWIKGTGNQWNQDDITAGASEWDAWTSGGVLQTAPVASTAGLTPHGTLHQGWPISVSGTLVDAVVRDTVLASPPAG